MTDTEGSKPPEGDKVVTEIKEEISEGGLTVDHLKQLEKRLEDRIQIISKDKSKDAEDKAKLEGQVEKLSERIDDLIKIAEERDKPRNDESTIVIPPPSLDPPTHQNVTDDAKPENVQGPPKKKRLPWW